MTDRPAPDVLYNERMEPEIFKNSGDDDCVEAEIVSGPGAPCRTGGAGHRGKRDGKGARRRDIPFYDLIQRIRFLLAFLGILAGFALIFMGFILTSTVIGAVIGESLRESTVSKKTCSRSG